MGKRGAISARVKRSPIKSDSTTAGYPSPTVGMTARGKTVWKEVVTSFPPGHFTESDRILLEQFCEAAAVHRWAVRFLEKNGRSYFDNKGVERQYLAVEDQLKMSRICSMIATKLRITKQSMISPKVAGRAASDAADFATVVGGEFGDLLFTGQGVKQ